MHIDWWTLALQAVNVLILVWLLSRFLFRPIQGILNARQAAADALLADAQAQKEAAVQEEEALKARNAAFAAEAAGRRAAMHDDVEAERARLLDQAQAQAQERAQQADAAAAALRARMTVALEAKAADLAGQMAGRLLRRLPPERTTDALFDDLAARVRALPAEERAALAADAPLVVTTPQPLSDADRARYGAALVHLLPGLTAPDYAVDPALIAGFELKGPHREVRNSWRADLDAMLAALKEKQA